MHGRRIVAVENLTAFEPFVRQERPDETVAVFTSGFPGSLQLKFLELLTDAGVDEIHHWGDLDAGGLHILQYLADSLNADVQLFRMKPALLEKLPTRQLTSRDRERLRTWVEKPQS